MSESESMDSPDVIGPSAPMPTDAEAWKARFMNMVLSEGWPESMARRAAETEYRRMRETELLALLRWVYEQSRIALFERTHRKACKAALDALSEINHKLAPYK